MGARPEHRRANRDSFRFQSTRPRGARLGPRPSDLSPVQVSIHAPAGSATQNKTEWSEAERVSIHAPAGGATAGPKLSEGIVHVSIHAPAGGATPSGVPSMYTPRRFQSTRPRGARPGRAVYFEDYVGFNPRARGGRDGTTRALTLVIASFNPRARGGRDRGRLVRCR